MLTAMVIAMLTAITIWWLLIQRLKEKPWLSQGVLPASQDSLTSSAPKVGLWVFLAVVSSLFGIFASAYMMRVNHSHGELVHWLPLNEPKILWGNTAFLILASVAMQIAHFRSQHNDVAGLRKFFVAGGALTIVFLAGQLLAWQELAATGQYGPEHPAYTFFILLTGVHGLHLIGGLLVLARTARRVWHGVDPANPVVMSKLKMSVQLCTLYWHWLLLIWFGVFALLLTT